MMTKSKEAKKRQGTYRTDRKNKNPVTYEVLSEVPESSAWLSETGEYFYKKTCELLISAGIMTSADIDEVTQAAEWFDVFWAARRDLNENGYYYTGNNGYTQTSASWTVFATADAKLSKFYNKYGLNPASRKKIEVERPHELDDLDRIRMD